MMQNGDKLVGLLCLNIIYVLITPVRSKTRFGCCAGMESGIATRPSQCVKREVQYLQTCEIGKLVYYYGGNKTVDFRSAPTILRTLVPLHFSTIEGEANIAELVTLVICGATFAKLQPIVLRANVS